VGFFFNF